MDQNTNSYFLPRINIVGKNKVELFGIKNVLEFSSCVLRVSFGKYSVKIDGCDFCIEEFNDNGILLVGKVMSVGFCDD